MYKNGSANGAVKEQPVALVDILPNSPEAERAALGSILIDPDAFYLIDTIIGPDDFFSVVHGQIYKAIADLYAGKVSIDLLTVIETMKRRGVTECYSTSIDDYIISLINYVPTAINAPDYARIIEADALRRRLILAGRKIENVGMKGDSPAKLIEESERALFDVTQKIATVNVLPSRMVMSELLTMTQARQEQGGDLGVNIGLMDIDKILGGLKSEELIILAARPGMGKSMLEGQIAVNCARRYGPVARFNLEMGHISLAQRMVAADTGIPFKKIQRAELTNDEQYRFNQSVGALAELPIYTDDSAGLTMSQLTAKARRLHAEHGLKLITLDYLQ
ncbi:MAG: replicative DNA helicase, partial [Candidatus Puniceispirillaceae bacterium]